MKRVRMGGLVALAFLFCSVPGRAQNTYVSLKTVFTLGGTVNAVPKFTTANHIGNSAITETGGNVTITGGITAGGTVSGTQGNFSTSITGGTVTGTSGNFSGIITNGSGGISTGGNIHSAGSGTFAGSVNANFINVTGNIISNGIVFSGTGNWGAQALSGNNNSSLQTLQLQNFAAPSGSNFMEAQFNASGSATFFTDTLGDTVARGTKSAVVPMLDGTMAKMFSVESPEVWFEDYGSGQLNGGMITVSLEEKFAQTVNLSKGYHVFLTPKGDCKGLYVTNETETGFEVRETGGGGSSVEFDYRIVAHRKGYEDQRLPTAIMPKLATR
jgi:hypothetical protein